MSKAQWNSRLQQLNITGFSDAGVRGVHEVPEAFKSWLDVTSINAAWKQNNAIFNILPSVCLWSVLGSDLTCESSCSCHVLQP